MFMSRRCKHVIGKSFVVGMWLAFTTVTAHAHFILGPLSCGPTVTIPGDGTIVGCSGSVFLSPDQFITSGPPDDSPWFTLYDFGDVTGGVTAIITTGLLSSGWAITNNLTDAPAIGTTPIDDPAIANVRFTCTACGDLVGPLDLGAFGLPTAGQDDDRVLTYDSQAFASSTGALTGNLGSVLVPAFAPVPEPATLLLFGIGMLGLRLARRLHSV